MAANAQGYVNKISGMVHSTGKDNSYGLKPPLSPAGENLCWAGKPKGIKGCIEEWYREYKNCEGTGDMNKCAPTRAGHWSAMIWKYGMEFGCGVKKQGKGKGIGICQYRGGLNGRCIPNMSGAFKENCPHKV